jgi:hypothetical protein
MTTLEQITEEVRKLPCHSCGSCAACVRLADEIRALWAAERAARTRTVRIEFEYLLDDRDLVTIGRVWGVGPDGVTDDMIRDYTTDALTTELMNEEATA